MTPEREMKADRGAMGRDPAGRAANGRHDRRDAAALLRRRLWHARAVTQIEERFRRVDTAVVAAAPKPRDRAA